MQFQLVLYVRRNEPESAHAIQLLRNLGIKVSYLEDNDESATPWLVTEKSSYRGIEMITGYVEHWRKLVEE